MKNTTHVALITLRVVDYSVKSVWEVDKCLSSS